MKVIEPGASLDVTPHEDSLHLAHRAACALALIGGLTCAGGVLTITRTPAAQQWQLGVAAALVVVGLAIVVSGPSRRLAQIVPALGSMLLAVLIARVQPLGLTPFFELWPIVYAAYFSSRRELWASFTLMSLSLAVALAVNPHIELRLDTWVGTTMTVGLMAWLVAKSQQREARLHAELSAAARTDSLTGVLNRRGFLPRLLELAGDGSTAGGSLGLVSFDLDNFKLFNDTHGHLAGDDALCRMAGALIAASRQGDVIARLGGEEFAVALPGCDLTGARAYARRVAAHLARTQGMQPLVTASAGVAMLGDGDLRAAIRQLLSRADEALYAAKSGGRSRAAWWQDARLVIGSTMTGDDGPAPIDPTPLGGQGAGVALTAP